ncbi:type II toxin-antitoxin system HicB family antitoxin [Spirulina major CS-329]|nr:MULTISPECIES: type II toxin-antitoxin system HicB family antitoxin [Spirulina]MDB9493154.1 type II toxin-antitoxin system HicB family antitoxin [Spirulina subsalsa CS-330]MDB9502292.1 type II toxin-antitoxin system HicB family antitoxin [Spirulina major CS-329]
MTNPIINARTVLLYTDEDGIFIAEVPSLPSCISQG